MGHPLYPEFLSFQLPKSFDLLFMKICSRFPSKVIYGRSFNLAFVSSYEILLGSDIEMQIDVYCLAQRYSSEVWVETFSTEK